MFVDATRYRSSGAEAFIQVKNHSYGVNEPFAPTPEDVIALADSTAAGTIHTFSAGNNRGQPGQDSNKKDLQKSPDSITVAALGSSGVFATYSNFGACVFVTAPSSSNRQGEVRSPSTDREAGLGYNQTDADSDPMPALEYTSSFGGTSASAPVVAGVMGLLKQANPAANTRFAKHLLARTSDVVDAADNTTNSDGGWRTNAAGFRFNQNYGFGLVDAEELVSLAPRYLGVTPLVTVDTGEQVVGEAIPDNSAVGLTRQVVVSGADLAPLEEVLVSLRVTHAYRGDLEAYLTSPSGYASRVFIRSANDGGDDIDWTFTMNSFWGESAGGIWSLRLADVAGNSAGTWESFSLQFRTGTLLTIAVPEPVAAAWLIPAGVVLARRARRKARG
jgi:kexin